MDAVGHVANKADGTKLDIGQKPTAPLAMGALVILTCLSYSCWLSQCRNAQTLLLHVLGPPRSADRHGLWKWQGFLLCWFLLDLPDFGQRLNSELLLASELLRLLLVWLPLVLSMAVLAFLVRALAMDLDMFLDFGLGEEEHGGLTGPHLGPQPAIPSSSACIPSGTSHLQG